MNKQVEQVEDILVDEDFLGWYKKSSPIAIRNWEEWMTQNPALQPLVNQAVQCLETIIVPESRPDEASVEKATNRLWAQVEKEDKKLSLFYSWSWWKLAIVAGLFVLVLSVELLNPYDPRPTIRSNYGEVITQTLPDGSVATLNANTLITFSNYWQKYEDREIWVQGEVFLDIQPLPGKTRFIVHARHLDLFVTGTRFFVYSRDDSTTVLNQEGSLLAEGEKGEKLSMKPGECIVFNKQSGHISFKLVNPDHLTAWKEKKLSLDKTSIRDIGLSLEQHYGMKVVIEDSRIATKTLTAILPNDSLPVVLQALESASGLDFERKNFSIHIKARQP